MLNFCFSLWSSNSDSNFSCKWTSVAWINNFVFSILKLFSPYSTIAKIVVRNVSKAHLPTNLYSAEHFNAKMFFMLSSQKYSIKNSSYNACVNASQYSPSLILIYLTRSQIFRIVASSKFTTNSLSSTQFNSISFAYML